MANSSTLEGAEIAKPKKQASDKAGKKGVSRKKAVASVKKKAAKKTRAKAVIENKSAAGKKGSQKKDAKKAAGPKAPKPLSMKELEKKHGINLKTEAKRLEEMDAEARVAWALEKFDGKIAMSSSFGAQSAVSLHMMTRQYPDIPVILVDTGYLFTETYQFIEDLTKRLKLNLQVYSNPLTPAWQEAKYGKLWEQGVEGIKQYNDMNKVEPMNRALEDLQVEALFSGLRRQQSSSRQKMPVVVSQRGRIKVHPIVDWTDMQVGMYLVDNKLPYHPLWDEGYVSIGDWHTTRKLTDGMTAEDTRFFGLKRECGLNEDVDFQI